MLKVKYTILIIASYFISIYGEQQLQYKSDSIITNNNETNSNNIELNKCWILKRINGKKINSKNAPYIKLNTDGSISGNTGCNIIGGNFLILNKTEIKFLPFTTKILCEEKYMRNEKLLIKILLKTKNYKLHKNKLILLDNNKKVIAEFKNITIR